MCGTRLVENRRGPHAVVGTPRIIQFKSMGLFSWAKAKPRAPEGPLLDDATVKSGIEQVVEQVDPRLRLITSYQKKLKPGVEVALRYAAELAAGLPPAREASAKTWNSDPTIHALFSSVADLRTFFGRSKGMRTLLSTSDGNLEEGFAMLAMSRREQTRFGARSDGDRIHRDVMQTSVDFFDRVLLAPATTEEEVKRRLQERVFERLVLHTLADLATKRSRKETLEREHAALKSRLNILQGQSVDEASPFEPGVIGTHDLEAVREKLARNERDLNDALTQSQTLDDSLAHVNAVLSQPEKHFQVGSITMRLDRMNIKVDDGASNDGDPVTLVEATVVGQEPRVGLLVKFPRSDLPPEEDFVKQARRYLS